MIVPPETFISAWSFPILPRASIAATWLVYLRGRRRAHQVRPAEMTRSRAVCFTLGLVSLWIAICSPIDALDDFLLTAHMTQHFILMSVAPPLLVLGAPIVPLLGGVPPLASNGIAHLRRKLVRQVRQHCRTSGLCLDRDEHRISGVARTCSIRSRTALRELAYGGASVLFSHIAHVSVDCDSTLAEPCGVVAVDGDFVLDLGRPGEHDSFGFSHILWARALSDLRECAASVQSHRSERPSGSRSGNVVFWFTRISYCCNVGRPRIAQPRRSPDKMDQLANDGQVPHTVSDRSVTHWPTRDKYEFSPKVSSSQTAAL
jgi:Cytochrome c oxidase caa3 assembly factor (Caa3_CtaG)